MAYEITWEDVKNTAKIIADKLDTFTTPQRELILEEANCHVPESYGGKWTKILRRYWAAHIAEQSTLETAGEGAITSDVIGSISASKNQPVNNPQASEPHLETTYGRMYDYYLKRFQARNIVGFGVYSQGRLQGFKKNIPVG